jgi:glycosyltransferase involved in cell wall biosynthesis
MNLPEKYVLFVGNRGLYKNFGCFIRAMAQLMSSDRELQVICGGSENFTPAENLLFDELSIAGRVSWRAFANDAELSSLYSHARAFVFPSMYEGFGIPVLEAFACGCPVAVSGCTSLPEVAADAAEYFQPESVDDIARAVSAVVYDTAKSSLLKQRGFERLSHFSWQKTAAATISLYQQLLNR